VKYCNFIKIEMLTAVKENIVVLWVIIPCGLECDENVSGYDAPPFLEVADLTEFSRC
jgi:hypothetical protein